jgi:F-type H+-transporting ATPase subunit epsilon
VVDKIAFRLVSPERKLFEEPVALAVMPGEDGQFGVGAGHTSLVASLKAGLVELYPEAGSKDIARVFISGGFADVTADSCVVLAEEAINVNELDEKALKAELDQLQKDLSLAVEQGDVIRYNSHIAVVEAKLEALAA